MQVERFREVGTRGLIYQLDYNGNKIAYLDDYSFRIRSNPVPEPIYGLYFKLVDSDCSKISINYMYKPYACDISMKSVVDEMISIRNSLRNVVHIDELTPSNFDAYHRLIAMNEFLNGMISECGDGELPDLVANALCRNVKSAK